MGGPELNRARPSPKTNGGPFGSAVQQTKKAYNSLAALRLAQALGQKLTFQARQILGDRIAFGAILGDAFFDQRIALPRVIDTFHLRVEICNLAMHLLRHWNFQFPLCIRKQLSPDPLQARRTLVQTGL